MLTLNSLASRIQALEEETYQSEDEALETWRNLLDFIFWRNRHGDDWRAAWDSLPLDSDFRNRTNHLSFFLYRFADFLTVNPYDERVVIAIDSAVSTWIENGISFEQLSSPDAMHEAFGIINNLLNKADIWEPFYAQKRAEAEAHEKRLLYRRQLSQGNISQDGLEWLRVNDSAFYEYNAHLIQPTKPQVLKSHDVTIAPVAQNPVAPMPVVELQPEGETVQVFYSGIDPEGSFSISTINGELPVHRYRVYTIAAGQWANIQQDSFLALRWQRVANGK